MRKHTPTSLSNELDSVVRSRFPQVLVEAEVGQLSVAPSGHVYLTLRDRNAQLKCICWRDDWNNLRFQPKQGDKVQARGRLSVYGRGGFHQLTVHVVTLAGEGDLARKIAEIKERLMRDGLLDPTRKRPLPQAPEFVGVATSLSSAALQDFLKVTGVRHPSTRILVAGCTVQGPSAAAEVIRAMDLLIEDGRSQVIVVTRGGGGKEDLLPFQDEQLARYIARCPIPVVSAVGHQIDTTMADLVADAVEPTPSAAAARVLPDDTDLRRRVDEAAMALSGAMRNGIERRRERVTSTRARLKHPGDRLADMRRRRETLIERLNLAAKRAVERRRGQVQAANGRLVALSPLAVLGRGYAIVHGPDGVVVDADAVTNGDRLRVRVANGEFDAVAGTGEPQLKMF